MAKGAFYKGRRKKRNFAIVPAVIVLFLLAVIIVLFYSTQKYAVITDEGVRVELPILTGKGGSSASGEDSYGGIVEYEQVSADISFIAADYSTVEANAGNGVKGARAIYIPYENLNHEFIIACADRLKTGNALMLQLKKNDGYIAYYSDAPIAYSYGLNMAAVDSKTDLQSIVDELKSRDIYLIAEISVLIDDLFASHAPSVSLLNQWNTVLYDINGVYIDPFNSITREYTVQLVRELWDMGFDEVVLANVFMPTVSRDESDESSDPLINYNEQMSTTPTSTIAISSFCVNICQQLEDRDSGKFVSVYIDTPYALVRADSDTGQDGRPFMKIFDRCFYRTDRYAYSYNCSDIEPYVSIGTVKNRLVPVVVEYLPDNTSWVLIDSEEDNS